MKIKSKKYIKQHNLTCMHSRSDKGNAILKLMLLCLFKLQIETERDRVTLQILVSVDTLPKV
jgi:hypothetical protein